MLRLFAGVKLLAQIRKHFFVLMFDGKIIQSPHTANMKVFVGFCECVYTVFTR